MQLDLWRHEQLQPADWGMLLSRADIEVARAAGVWKECGKTGSADVALKHAAL